MKLKHTNTPVCHLCNQKLLTAHPYLAKWVRSKRDVDNTLHVAWAYRSEEEQEACVKSGTSKVHYPFSNHNHEEDGDPCSLAVDLFWISKNGIALWSSSKYRQLDIENMEAGEPILWGGKFKTHFDGPHFEMKT